MQSHQAVVPWTIAHRPKIHIRGRTSPPTAQDLKTLLSCLLVVVAAAVAAAAAAAAAASVVVWFFEQEGALGEGGSSILLIACKCVGKLVQMSLDGGELIRQLDAQRPYVPSSGRSLSKSF